MHKPAFGCIAVIAVGMILVALVEFFILYMGGML